LETFFLTEEKRLIRTQNFRDEQTFQDLCILGSCGPGIRGNASIAYYISGATPGYRVVVSVRVVHDDRSGSCSTSFIPHR
jgi:hypothetical protein